MSDGGESDDKTEEPTEKKLREAFEKGDVAQSREIPLFAGLMAALIACTLLIRDRAIALADALAHLLDDPGHWTLRNGADVLNLLAPVGQAAFAFLLPIVLVFTVAGLTSSFAQQLPSFVLDRIMPKLSKISPASGLSRLLGKQGLFEFGKACFKLVTVGFVAALILHSQQQQLADAMFTEPSTMPDQLLGMLTRLLSGVGTVFVLLAAGDFVWSKVSWRNRQRMTRREVKDEHKQAEGDPIVKAKRRSLQLDRSRKRMMADVPRATVIIANPTHFAIALRYRREEGGAPMVLAKGTDLIALKIREIAEENGIQVVENKPLARSMYEAAQVSQAIPPEFYKAVAEIIHYVQSRSAPRSNKKIGTVNA